MLVKVTDLVLNKNYIQDTKELKNRTEKGFFEYLDRKKGVLKYEIIK
jgi:hypothetical protein